MYKNLIIFAMALFLTLGASAQNKREFRGAWIQCVNGQFMGKSTQQIQSMLSKQLDELEKDGVNAIIFQVRAECDALYESQLEPWSKFLTGTQGQAPNPYWDPLAWMVEQCHKEEWKFMPGSIHTAPNMDPQACHKLAKTALSSNNLNYAFPMII